MEQINTLEHPSPNIQLGKDGKYLWYHELNMLTNPTILFMLWKIFFWVFFGIWVLLLSFSLFDGYLERDFWNLTLGFALILLGFEVLVAFCYFIYAAFLGFKYCVVFQMDDEGVVHKQADKQFRKAQKVAGATILTGMAGGKPGVVGTGLLAASKQSMSSTWTSVRSIEIYRRRGVIKVNELFNKNQVYAAPEDFPWVEQFIRSHVTEKCKIIERWL